MFWSKKNLSLEKNNIPESKLSSLSWEISIVEAERKSARLAWKICMTSLMIGLISITCCVIVLPLKSTEIKVVTVDKLTGETGLSGQLNEYALSSNELNDKYWTKRFLVARERYSYKILQADYDVVRLLAADIPWKNYSNLFEGSNSLEKLYGSDIEIIPTILSSTISANSIATIRYELKRKDLRNSDHENQKIERRVATIRFHYSPNLKASERDLIENPFGFTVDSYQSVLEVAGISPIQAESQ